MYYRVYVILFVLCFHAFSYDHTQTYAAVGNVSYLEYNSTTKKFDQKQCSSYINVTSSDNTWGNDGNAWYVVDGNITIENYISVSGNVNLILINGCILQAKMGIFVPTSASITIYAQTTDESVMGKLISTGYSKSKSEIPSSNAQYGEGIAGIGAMLYQPSSSTDYTNSGSGAITIHGGNLDVTGGWHCAGIGSTYNGGVAGAIVINGGKVVAKGGYYGAGIGAGDGATFSSITINGGNITATGDGKAPGIGGVKHSSGNQSVTILGGTVTALGGLGDNTNEAEGTYASHGIESQTLTVDGGALLYAGSWSSNSSSSHYYTWGARSMKACVVFQKVNGSSTVYNGSCGGGTSSKLTQNLIMKDGDSFSVPSGTILTISSGLTIDFSKGTLSNLGTIVNL